MHLNLVCSIHTLINYKSPKRILRAPWPMVHIHKTTEKLGNLYSYVVCISTLNSTINDTADTNYEVTSLVKIRITYIYNLAYVTFLNVLAKQWNSLLCYYVYRIFLPIKMNWFLFTYMCTYFNFSIIFPTTRLLWF